MNIKIIQLCLKTYYYTNVNNLKPIVLNDHKSYSLMSKQRDN